MSAEIRQGIAERLSKESEILGLRMEISKKTNDPFRNLSPLSREIPKFDNVPSFEDSPREKSEVPNKREPDSRGNENISSIFELSEKGDAAPEQTDTDENVNNVSEGIRRIPKENGAWTGEPGNSKWVPDKDYIPKVYNPDEEKWRDILEKYRIDGIDFNDGEPDFSEVADATVEIDDFSDSRAKNFAQADEKLAEQWNKEAKDGRTDWTSDDVVDYREENSMTWHERSDMKTMDLVPSEVHNNVPHSGGISEIKKHD